MGMRSRDVANPDRRAFLRGILAAGGTALLASRPGPACAASPLTRSIPASGEALPLVGLGSWITFNVGNDAVARDACAEVMRAFFDDGGRLIDCSPMYGSSQQVIGHGLARLAAPPPLFSAEKVWITSGTRGPAQIEASRQAWRVARFDLLQVHNLLSWREHLPTLLAMKTAGRLRYVGITTSEGRRHRELEQIMATQPLDFVQLTYNVLDREAEQRLMPLARERRIALIVNRPFRQGELTMRLARRPLPGWAAEIGCMSWAQVLLKFIISHPAVTCAIPATTRVDHVRENMAAARAPLPDAALRARIVRHIEAL
jgi:diketogulonate reductase-like aldo/keto reductase